MQKIVAVVTLLCALLLVNWSIYQKEDLLENGKVIYLKLAPVDPRSLMQGDYMALRFDIADQILVRLKESGQLDLNDKSQTAIDGLVIVHLDEKSIASLVNIVPQDKMQEVITKKETVLQFRLRGKHVKFATNAYFFEEGSGNRLAAAKFGKFRVNDSGALLLVSLHDKHLKELG
jgi:uncharacterized membrane-anchored protein